MGEVERYPHGTFCWVDLGTIDVAASRTFYRGLLGWEFEDVPTGDGVYTLCQIDGKPVAGMHAHAEEDAPPPHWDSYIAVDDADAALERARRLGARVVMEPFEIPGAARMAAIVDGGGANVSLWQARGHPGARLVNEPGTWTWNDLLTRDADRAASFYGDLFGWQFKRAIATYGTFTREELLIGGMRTLEEGTAAVPPHWLPYFVCQDAAATARRVEELGGQAIVPPTDVPAGRFFVTTDPAGASAALFEMGPDGPFGGVDRL